MLFVCGAVALVPGGWSGGQQATEEAALAASGPVARFFYFIHSRATAVWEPYFEGARLREENRALREEMAQMQLEASEQRRGGSVSGARAALEGLSAEARAHCLAAPVLAIGPIPPARTYIIGRGKVDGVEPNMAVLFPPGIAGIVRQVSDRQALVQLAVDRRTQWGAVVNKKNPIRGILKGTGEWDRLQFVFEDAPGDTAAGDVIATAGVHGSLFPGGLPIGEVIDVEFDKTGRRIAWVAPFSPLSTAREVFVILETPPAVDPALLGK